MCLIILGLPSFFYLKAIQINIITFVKKHPERWLCTKITKKKKKKMSVQIGMVGYFHLHGIFSSFLVTFRLNPLERNWKGSRHRKEQSLPCRSGSVTDVLSDSVYSNIIFQIMCFPYFEFVRFYICIKNILETSYKTVYITRSLSTGKRLD